VTALRAAGLLWLAGCGSTAIDVFETCDLEATLDVNQGAPGDTVVASGGPWTTSWDTRVEIGGVPAPVTAVTRNSACGECEVCREEAECLICGTCIGGELDEARRIECFGDPFDDDDDGLCGQCEETVTFVVPAIAPGSTTLVLITANGASSPQPFVVLAVDDTGDTSDTASSSTGDTGVMPTLGDTGPGEDTGPGDDTGLADDTGDAPETGDTGEASDDTGLASDTGNTAITGDTAATGDTAPPDDTSPPTDTGPAPPTGETGDTGPS
jgi:hypothetical protein